MKSLRVPLPPLPEQRRIAAIVDKAEALRAKRREAIAKLDGLAFGVFVEIFGDARGLYSRGSTESLLNEDLAIIFRSGDIAALLEPVKRQFGRLHVEPSDLAARGANSPLFSLSYLALKHAGAKDWSCRKRDQPQVEAFTA